MTDVDLLAAGDWLDAARGEPLLNLNEIPHHTSWRQRKAAREFPALLHPKDRTICERNHLLELLPADGPRVRPLLELGHCFEPSAIRLLQSEGGCLCAKQGFHGFIADWRRERSVRRSHVSATSSNQRLEVRFG